MREDKELIEYYLSNVADLIKSDLSPVNLVDYLYRNKDYLGSIFLVY